MGLSLAIDSVQLSPVVFELLVLGRLRVIDPSGGYIDKPYPVKGTDSFQQEKIGDSQGKDGNFC